MLCVGVIQVSLYYYACATVRPDHCLAVAQPDSALYLQAARRIVEGAPFSYSAGESVCTGTTSVLYPFILAVPYSLGMSGVASVVAAFVLNAIFYLLFLFCWAQVIDLKVREPLDKAIAALALSLFGQSALVSLSQSDIGLWLLVSALFAWGLAADNPRVFIPALVIGPWVRPEGMVCVIAFALVAVAVRRYRVAAAFALASAVGVFVFNGVLTGSLQFSSVQGKGYFAQLPFCQAAVASVKDALTMFRQMVLGFPSGTVREMFFPPILGAACVFFHVFSRDYSDFDWRESVYLLACAGGFATVAASSWQGTNYDRYLAWILPVVVIWMALGAVSLGRRMKGVARFLPAAAVLCFFAFSSIGEVLLFRIGCEKEETARSFYERCETLLPQGASMGGFGHASSAHWLSSRRFAHLNGIYSPEFMTHKQVSVLEVLKNEPSTRFDYWIMSPDVCFGEAFNDATCRQLAVGPFGMKLCKADWHLFDVAAKIPTLNGYEMVVRVDVGYEKEELQSDYICMQRYLHEEFEPFLKVAEGIGDKMVEVARMISGYDEMSVPLAPGKDVKVIMRTFGSCDVVSRGAFGSNKASYEITSPAKLNVAVDGNVVSTAEFTCSSNVFSDVVISIPGEAVTRDVSRVGFMGDHIAGCYWFYQ